MKVAHYVIIGNGVAAVGCIEGIRSVDKETPITVVSGEKHPVYCRPLISYYLEGATDLEKMNYRPADFYEANGCTVLYGHKAVSLDEKKKQVTLDDGETLGYQTGKQRTTAMTQTATASGGSLTIGAAAGSFTTAYTARTVTVRLHSASAISHAMLDGKPAAVKRIPRDSAAFPLAETGAAPDSDVYEITFEASLASAHTLTWATVRGDLDGDGEVTLQDVFTLLRSIG